MAEEARSITRRIGAAALVTAVAAALAVGCAGAEGSTGSRRAATADRTLASGGANTSLVGLVTDVDQLHDHGFNHLAYVVLMRAQIASVTDRATRPRPSTRAPPYQSCAGARRPGGSADRDRR